MYKLPPPLALVQYPPTMKAFKALVRSKVLDYLEVKFRQEAALLKYLSYFKPDLCANINMNHIVHVCDT